MRSRSSTMASRWTCSCRRAFSMAIAAWRANVSTSAWSSAENSAAPALSVRYRLPDRAALHRDRDAEEAVHRRVVRREAVATRVDRDVGDPERLVLADDQAEEAMAAGQGADRRPRRRAHAGRDEALDDAVLVDDAQRGVARPDERPDLVDDDLQDLVDGDQPGDRAGRRVEGLEDLVRSRVPERCAPRGRAYQRWPRAEARATRPPDTGPMDHGGAGAVRPRCRHGSEPEASQADRVLLADRPVERVEGRHRRGHPHGGD